MTFPRVGIPSDPAQWAALATGVLVLVAGARAAHAAAAKGRERAAVAALAITAAALSWAYVVAYLRGGPRIIDATSYWLEARGLASGQVTWPAGEPETASLGRFLVRSEGPEGARAAVLFPPGYPLLLAIGFAVGAPLAVGPLLAAALVVATYALAKEVTREEPQLARVPLIAAALSVVCGALRYHTADTMSHGLAALCFTAGIALLLRAVRAPAGRGAHVLCGLAGLCGGWLFSARPASGMAWGVTALVVIAQAGPAGERRRVAEGARLAAAVALGALPFATVFLVHQRLATGQWWLTTHAASYATNDGPAGCFRYGFGAGIGCLGEHGDFVRANLPDGFGAVAAVKTTARRLWMHLVDAGNAEPLALLVPAGAALAWARPAVRALAWAVGLQIAAYVPFYFDGNYPGGGARLFADVLPLEHVLLAIAAVRIAARRAGAAGGAGAWIVGLALIGFALRAGFDHAQLRDRDGGAPLFSQAQVTSQGVTSGLLFVDSDAAYDLAFDPGRARDEAGGFDVARYKGDALDALAWTERGSPPAYVVRFEAPPGGGPGRSVVVPYSDLQALPPSIEGESIWPPRAQEGGAYVLPVHAGGTCASGGRALWLFRGPGEGGAVRVGLPGPLVAGRTVGVEMVTQQEEGAPLGAVLPGDRAVVDVALEADGRRVAFESVTLAVGATSACETVLRAAIPAGSRRVDLVLGPRWAGGGDPDLWPLIALDRVTVNMTAP